MPVSGVIARAMVAAVIVLATPVGGSAQPTLKIFDAHLHYNQIRAVFPKFLCGHEISLTPSKAPRKQALLG
jgi:hypothetical protein